MNERPPAPWPFFGLASLAAMLAGSILISDERKPTLALVLTIVGTAGLLAFSWAGKRHRQR